MTTIYVAKHERAEELLKQLVAANPEGRVDPAKVLDVLEPFAREIQPLFGKAFPAAFVVAMRRLNEAYSGNCQEELRVVVLGLEAVMLELAAAHRGMFYRPQHAA